MERNEARYRLEYLKSCTMVTEDFEGLDEALSVAIAALSDHWVPCSERLPTAEDADVAGEVYLLDGNDRHWMLHYSVVGDFQNIWTHWMTPPAGQNGGANDRHTRY